MNTVKSGMWPIICGLLLLLGLWLRSEYAQPWLDHRRVIFADADCYTRMTRVKLLITQGAWIQPRNAFENYPDGIATHTTAPFDFAIAALVPTCHLFVSNPFDWAGAVVSPLCYLALAFAFWRWSPSWPWSARLVLLLGCSALPGLVWATPFARPDHQSLVLLLTGLALWGETRRWQSDRLAVVAWTGITWALALWTSLFEPGVLLGLCLVLNLIFRRKEQPVFLLGLFGGLLVFVGMEGIHGLGIPSGYAPYFERWLATIGEDRPSGMGAGLLFFSLPLILLPWILFQAVRQRRQQTELLILSTIALVLTVLTFDHQRWLYEASLVQLVVMALWLKERPSAAILGFFAFGLVASTCYALTGDRTETRITAETQKISSSIQGPGSILGPWWLSPAALYTSGQPIVASSSHQSLPGIVDSARFFTTDRWPLADEILQRRQVRWVLVYDADALLENSTAILGLKPFSEFQATRTVASRLWRGTAVPPRFQLRAVTEHLRLYEYLP